jgi:hypothetical protein
VLSVIAACYSQYHTALVPSLSRIVLGMYNTCYNIQIGCQIRLPRLSKLVVRSARALSVQIGCRIRAHLVCPNRSSDPRVVCPNWLSDQIGCRIYRCMPRLSKLVVGSTCALPVQIGCRIHVPHLSKLVIGSSRLVCPNWLSDPN